MTSIEEIKRKYSHLFSKKLLHEVETWNAYGQAFFWLYAERRLPQVQDEQMIRRMEREKQGCIKPDGEPTALPFKAAEQAITPSGHFGRSIVSQVVRGEV